MGGLSISGIAGRHALGPAAYAIAALLAIAGVFLLLRRTFAFWIGMLAGTVTAVTGVLAWAHHPELALPVPPLLSIVVGLYLVARTAMLRALSDNRATGFLPRDKQQG